LTPTEYETILTTLSRSVLRLIRIDGVRNAPALPDIMCIHALPVGGIAHWLCPNAVPGL